MVKKIEKDKDYYLNIIKESDLSKTEKVFTKVLFEQGLMTNKEIEELVNGNDVHIETDKPLDEGFVKNFIKELRENKEDDNINFIKIPPFSIESANVNTILGEYLEKNGISQTWLAETTGLSRGTIVNMIKNPSSASMLNAKKVCLALSKRFDELFY